MLRAGFWLALLLIVAKAATLGLPALSDLPRSALTLLMASWSDALFALSCGTIGEVVLRILRRWPRLSAAVRAVLLGLFALCAAYAVASVGLFRYFNRPLTFQMLTLVDNAAIMRSSILERITVPIAIALVLFPAVFLFLALRVGRTFRFTVLAVAGVGLWIAAGWPLSRACWRQEKRQHLWLSPHAELLRTTVGRLAGGRRPGLPANFPPAYLEEFRTFGAREGATSSHFHVPPGIARPRNVILVVLESVGTNYLALYGSAQEITPHLTAESRHALVFENIYAHASFTFCSFRSLNFSVYPGLPWHYALIDDGRPAPTTLASIMKTRGARTAYFSSGDLFWADQHWLLTQHGDLDLLADPSDKVCPLLSSWGTEDRCAFERLITWLGEKPDAPFVAVIWTDQTHDPYVLSPQMTPIDVAQVPVGTTHPADLERYLTILHDTDKQLGRMFAALRERGLAEDTLVVLTGDHGEAFGDLHGQRGHAWSVYEEEVRVPLLIWNPRLFPESKRVASIGGHVDVNPTLTDLLGLEPDREWQGHSLFDPARPNRAYFMAIGGGNIFGVRDGEWKYMHDVTNGRELLFHLGRDPTEQDDLAGREPARARELRERVAAWVTFEEAFLRGHEN